MPHNKSPLSVIILTYNEEINLSNALESVISWTNQVFVVDSFSNDKTLDVARNYGVDIYQNTWKDWATQRNWALDNLPLKHEWVLFLDADERVSPELAQEISELLKTDLIDVSGFYINRKFIFLGKWLKHGGHNPNWNIRFVRRNKTRVLLSGDCEYFRIDGSTLRLKSYLIHEDKKSIDFFINKHMKISQMAANRIISKEKVSPKKDELKYILERNRRVWVKENILYKLPLFLRPFILFTYRYFLKLGFLDGKEGFIFYFLHDFWYPFLVDIKIIRLRKEKLLKF